MHDKMKQAHTTLEYTTAPSLWDRCIQLLLQAAYPLMLLYCKLFWQSSRGAVVAVRYEDRILMIRNSYRRGYSLPGGFVGRNEQPLHAAVRELREEVSLRIAPQDLRFITEISVGGKNDSVFFFEYRVAEPPFIKLDKQEVVWAGFVPLQNCLELKTSPHIRRYLRELAASQQS